MSNFSDLFDDLLKKGENELNKGIKNLNKTVTDMFGEGEQSNASRDASDEKYTAPLINIVETNNSFKASVAAPGLEKSDFKLQIENNALTIRGAKAAATLGKGESYLMHEHSYGKFERSFSIPDTVDQQKIGAAYKNGVLTITLGKKASAIRRDDIDIDIM